MAARDINHGTPRPGHHGDHAGNIDLDTMVGLAGSHHLGGGGPRGTSGGGHGPGKPYDGPPSNPHGHGGGGGNGGHNGGNGGNNGGNGGGNGGDHLGQKKQNAFDLFIGLLEDYGFGGNKEIAREVRKMIVDGVTDFQQIELGLRDTQAWKRRFAGNEQRRAAGLNALSVSEYLATEKSYADILHQAGLPQGFYDDPSDFAGWIGGSTSPAELAERVGEARDLMNRNEDPAVLKELSRYGFTEGDLLSKWLDPKRSSAALQQKYKQVLIGAAGRRVGVTVDKDYADKLAGMGITEQQAAAGYGTVADITHSLQDLGDVYHEDYDQSDAEAEVFENNKKAADKRKRLSGQENAAFSGSSGTSQQSLGRSSAGSY